MVVRPARTGRPLTTARLRRAGTADLAAIQRLAGDAFEVYVARIGRQPAPMTADYAAALEYSRVWVIEEGDGLVGFIVNEAYPDHLLIDSVAVSPAAQGGGHGRRLLERAEADARELGLPELRLCTNEAMTENQQFYPRQGFHETGRGVEDGYRRVFYARAVLPA